MTDTMTREFITPMLAHTYLARNIDNNRRISKPGVVKTARDMLAGNWVVQGNAIQFDINSRLFDGQHRLSAVIKAGEINSSFKGVFMWVARNVAVAGVLVSDIGIVRTATSLFDIAFGAQKLNNYKSSISRMVYLYNNHLLDTMEGTRVSQAELRDTYTNDQESIDIAADYAKQVKRDFNHPTAFGFAYWLITRLSPLGEEFMDKLGTGAGLSLNDPIYTFRRSYLNRRKNSSDPQFVYRLALLDAIYRSFMDWMEDPNKPKMRYNFTRHRFSKLRKGFYDAAPPLEIKLEDEKTINF